MYFLCIPTAQSGTTTLSSIFCRTLEAAPLSSTGRSGKSGGFRWLGSRFVISEAPGNLTRLASCSAHSEFRVSFGSASRSEILNTDILKNYKGWKRSSSNCSAFRSRCRRGELLRGSNWPLRLARRSHPDATQSLLYWGRSDRQREVHVRVARRGSDLAPRWRRFCSPWSGLPSSLKSMPPSS